MSEQELSWQRVADLDELPAGRVKTVTAGVHSMALTNIDGEYSAMDNRCPHQGGRGSNMQASLLVLTRHQDSRLHVGAFVKISSRWIYQGPTLRPLASYHCWSGH